MADPHNGLNISEISFVALQHKWRTILRPSWRAISLLTWISTLDLFCEVIAKTGINPKDVYNDDPVALASKSKLSLHDAGAVCIGIRRYKILNNLNTTDPHIPRNDLDEIVLTSLDMLGVSSGERTAQTVSDILYAERALISLEEDGRGVDFSQTLLCSAGPEKTIDAEQEIHTVLTIPEVVLISSSLAELYSVSTGTVENVRSVNFLYAHIGVSALTLFVIISAFIFSLLHISLCSFTKLTDRSAAHYLATKQFIRFTDLILIVIGTVLFPLSLIFRTAAGMGSLKPLPDDLQAWALTAAEINEGMVYIVSISYLVFIPITLIFGIF